MNQHMEEENKADRGLKVETENRQQYGVNGEARTPGFELPMPKYFCLTLPDCGLTFWR